MSLLDDAVMYYHNNLYKYPHALNYLYRRGITNETIIKFKLGYSSHKKELYDFLIDKYSYEDLENSGLFKNTYDILYGHIVTPSIFNGNVIGITGRNILGGTPKYKNIKGQRANPYNMDALNKEGDLIIAEGQFDTMILDQAGFRAVGVIGVNNFNKDFIEWLLKTKDKIYFCFDNDENLSGFKGALKNASLLWFSYARISYICTLPREKNIKKIDINELYLSNESEFCDIIMKCLIESAPYTKTDHYKKLNNEIKKKKEYARGNWRVFIDDKDVIKSIKVIPIGEILKRYLGVELNGRHEVEHILCPFHADDKTRSFAVYKNSNRYYCYGCGKYGDQLDFVMEYFGITFGMAIKKIQTEFKLNILGDKK